MEIIKRTVHRQITEKEFLRLKETEPFSTFRQDSKAINFGMIFGISYRKFSTSSLETSWKHERVQQFIKDRDLYDKVEKMGDRHMDLEPKLWEYYVVADYLRTQFFETYPGLLDRINRNKLFAMDNGYVRSFHGAIRRVPMLMWAYDSDGKMRKDENGKEIANLVNITSNTTIQTDESVTVNSNINNWIAEESSIASVVGTIHDSVDFYVQKGPDAIPVLLKIKEMFEENQNWAKGIKFLVDITVCDLADPDNNWYKHGTPIKKMIEQLEGKVA
jgi:DNA polymerase I-like protein with 3'-5' exonuclease and polymerase domains